MNDLPEPVGSAGGGKLLAGLFSLAILVATLSPILQNWQEKPKDSFPLSYYLMFSAERPKNYPVNYFVGLDSRGNRYVISHKLAGKGGFNQTRRQINKVVRENRSADLCQKVAANLAAQHDPAMQEVIKVQLVKGIFRFDDYFGGDKKPRRETVLAEAAVERGTP